MQLNKLAAPGTFEKVAALGAVVVSGGVLVLYAALVALMWPTAAAGIDRIEFVVGVVACACPAGILIAIHLALARQLLRA